MKKHPHPPATSAPSRIKLTLRRLSLRPLDRAELARAAGGTGTMASQPDDEGCLGNGAM